jgi:dCMP deaminase
LHAEQNSILQAATYGVSIQNATLYCTTQPCSLCAKMLINAGIKKIFVADGYPDEFARSLLQEADIPVIVI